MSQNASAETVIVGMSGGVDSSVTAALLRDEGYNVIGVTLDLSVDTALSLDADPDEREDACCSLASVEDARRVADRLGIPHYTLNFREVFQRAVIDDFIAEYARGRTPNPCIRCNDEIKFAAVLDRAKALRARYVATGHYARIARDEMSGRYLLRRGVDPRKDQSYVLYVLTQDELARTLLPLGSYEKPQVRDLARKLGLRTAEKAESQDICFITEGDYRGFLARTAPDSFCPGPLLDTRGNQIGEHRGVALYTIGQRRGLGLATGEPLFVIRLDPRKNAVIVGPESDLMRGHVVGDNVNFVSMSEEESLNRQVPILGKTRYRMPLLPGVAYFDESGQLVVDFDEPIRAVTPGQALVIYNANEYRGNAPGEAVLAGATIVDDPASADRTG